MNNKNGEMIMTISVYALTSGISHKELLDYSEDNSLDDISRKLPQGVYSTFRTFDGARKALDLKTHLNRLYEPAISQGIQPSISTNELRQAMKDLAYVFHPHEARLRISLSLTENPGQVYIMLEPFKLLDEKFYQFGVNVVTSNVDRKKPREKSTDFILKSSQERKSLQENDIFEGLIIKNGNILEGLTSNFYALKDSRIWTARNGILLGVTRRIVIRLISRAGVELVYKPLRIAELAGIQEAFLTSSSRGVVPIVKINDVEVGQGVPGELAKNLRFGYGKYVIGKAENF